MAGTIDCYELGIVMNEGAVRELYRRLQGVHFRNQRWNAVKLVTGSNWRSFLDRKAHSLLRGEFQAEGSEECVTFIAIAKAHHDETGPEFLTMKRLWSEFYSARTSPYAIPEPLLWLPEYRLLVAERVKGSRLSLSILRDQLPFNGLRKRSVIENQFRQVAQWLLDFQQKTLKKDPFILLDYFHRTKELSATMQPPWNRLAHDTLKRAEALLSAGDDLPSVGWHGDFLHRNVLISKNQTTLVDWEGQWKYHSLHPLYEAFFFASNLECLAKSFKGVRLFRREKIKLLSDLFLRHYLMHRFFPLRQETLQIAYWLFLVEFLHNYAIQARGLSFRRTKDTDLFMKSWLLCQRDRRLPIFGS